MKETDNNFKGTPGEWSLPHIADKTTPCNCGFVLSSGGSAIATVHSNLDSSIENGDNPPIEEAVANAQLIAAAPELLEALQKVYKIAKHCDLLETLDLEENNYIESAINKALGK